VNDALQAYRDALSRLPTTDRFSIGIDKVEALEAMNVDLWHERGVTGAGVRLGKAMALARKGLQIEPKDPDALEAKACLLLRQGQLAAARKIYSRNRR